MIRWTFLPLLKAESTKRFLENWILGSDHESRVNLASKGMAPDIRESAIAKLATDTPTKTIGGQRHFLLHRAINESEVANIKGDVFDNLKTKVKIGKRSFPSVTSWSGSLLQIPLSSKRNIVSAWVPESHVAFFPPAYEKLLGIATSMVKREQEVIVKPGKFSVAHHSKRELANPNDGSTYFYMHRHGTELARKSGLSFKPQENPDAPFS